MPAGAVTVNPNAPTVLSLPVGGKGSQVLFINSGPGRVYIGDGQVTTSYGAPLDPYATLTMPGDRPWYGIAPAGADPAQSVSVVPHGIAATAQVGNPTPKTITPPSRRQSTLTATGALVTTAAATLTSLVLAGSTLIAVVNGNAGAITVADNIAGRWTRLTVTADGRLSLWACVTAAGSPTVTATQPAAGRLAVALIEYANMPAVVRLIASAAAIDGAAVTAHTSGNISTGINTDALLIGAAGDINTGPTTYTTPGGWQQVQQTAPINAAELVVADLGVLSTVGAGTYSFATTTDAAVISTGLIVALAKT